jgi:hypothetical protein
MDRWTDGQIGHMDIWTYGHMERWKDGKMDSWTDGQVGWTVWSIDGRLDKRIYGWADRLINRLTGKEVYSFYDTFFSVGFEPLTSRASSAVWPNDR